MTWLRKEHHCFVQMTIGKNKLPVILASIFSYFIFRVYNIYSVLNDFAGLVTAAFIVFKLTTTSANKRINKPTTTNSQILILIRSGYFSSQLFMNHHAIGVAITNAINTSFKK